MALIRKGLGDPTGSYGDDSGVAESTAIATVASPMSSSFTLPQLFGVSVLGGVVVWGITRVLGRMLDGEKK